MEKRLKNIQTFEQKTSELNNEPRELSISDVSESVSKEDRLLIDGSGLFFFKTRLDDETKLKITKWYKNISDVDREYVDILRNEASDESEYFSQGD
jgi:hypothetical protein